jgi:hypothetical protein
MKHSILNKNDLIMVPNIDIWTILPKRYSISLPIWNTNLQYRAAKRGKNVNIEGHFFDIKAKPSILGPILGGKDMQILNIGPDIEGFFFDIEGISSISNTILRYRRLITTISNKKYYIWYDIGYDK